MLVKETKETIYQSTKTQRMGRSCETDMSDVEFMMIRNSDANQVERKLALDRNTEEEALAANGEFKETETRERRDIKSLEPGQLGSQLCYIRGNYFPFPSGREGGFR